MRFLLPVVYFVCFTVPIATVRAAGPAPERTFRILNLAGELDGLDADGTQHGAMLYFDSPSGRVLVPVPYGKFPRARPIPADGKLALYRFEMAPAGIPMESIMPCCRAAVASGRPRKIIVARTTIPADIIQAVVVLSPAPDGSLNAVVCDDSPRIRGEDTILAFNGTARPVALRLGENTLEIPARSAQGAPFRGTEGAIPLKLGILSAEGNWSLVLNNVYSARPGYRVLAAICDYPGAEPGTPPTLTLDYEFVGTPSPPSLASR